MPRYSKTLTPAAQAAFVAAVAGGALIVAAARAVGVAISTLYWRRHRDPAFAAAWEGAVAGSSGPVFVPAQGGRPARLGKRRRVRFGASRRAAFLRELERTCHSGDSAEAAGVHKSTIYRRIARDPDFAHACAAALRRGYKRLEGVLAAERAAAAARGAGRAIAATGEPTEDFDEALKLMARWERPDGSIGPRFVRRGRQRSCSFEAAIEMLDRRLRGLGIPIAGEPEEGPSTSRGASG